MITITYVLSFVMPLVDVVTDLVNGINYLQCQHIYYGWTTIGTCFLPALAKIFSEVLVTIKFAWNDYKVFVATKRSFLLTRLLQIVEQLPLIQPLHKMKNIERLASLKEHQPEAQAIKQTVAASASWEP